MDGDAAYFARRAVQEREAALRTIHHAAREAHLEMARRYDDLANAITARERHLGLDLADDDPLSGGFPRSA